MDNSFWLWSQSTMEKPRGKCSGKEKACQSHKQVDMSLSWEYLWLKPTEKKADS